MLERGEAGWDYVCVRAGDESVGVAFASFHVVVLSTALYGSLPWRPSPCAT